jgi:hypothetical protein
MPTKPAPERRGTIHADKTAAWITLDGTKLALDDGERARELWSNFADRDVIVTGECYGAHGAQFRVHTLRVVAAASGSPGRFGLGAYLAVGPEQSLAGELKVTTAPPGSKLAGESQQVFVAADGTSYGIAGPYIVGFNAGLWKLRVRVLEPDMSYVARSLDRDIWVVDLHDQPRVGEPESQPCPP